MAILKCKMCGDNIEVSTDKTYGTCESCGSTMTLPKIEEEQRANLYNRANHFRRQNEFDKALAIYERMVGEDDTEAEAHWGAVLCRFGIEYVEDPATHERIPTCHRASYDSILQDVDYLASLKYSADAVTKSIYEKEATYIAGVQKDIISISQKEKPYDVFICYKETDASGSRTQDSALAQDVYYQLTNEGFKVFFSRITLEDKLGQAYEPYIFAALNSAKVMVIIGTQPDYYNAVWVKNEWSRYLKLLKTDKSRLLIPCYRGMDAYELPEELSMLQSQDMGKIGFVQDLIRGVKKVLQYEKPVESAAKSSSNPLETVEPALDALLKRGHLFLGDEDWEQAQVYFNRALDLDPECAVAYIGLVCVQFHLTELNQYHRGVDKLVNVKLFVDKQSLDAYLEMEVHTLQSNKNYQKAVKFASSQFAEKLETVEHETKSKKTKAYFDLAVKNSSTEEGKSMLLMYRAVFDAFGDYRDAPIQANRCMEKYNKTVYQEAMATLECAMKIEDYHEAEKLFKLLDDYKDSKGRAQGCIEMALELQYQEALKVKEKAMNTSEVTTWGVGGYYRAINEFKQLGNYKDSEQQWAECVQLHEESEHHKKLKIAEYEKKGKRLKIVQISIAIGVVLAFIIWAVSLM